MRFFRFQLDTIFISILISFNLLFLWQFIGSPYPEVSFSAPIIPVLGTVISKMTPFSFWQSIGILVIISFPVLSITWYLYLKRLFSNANLAFAASLILLTPVFLRERFLLFWETGDGAHGFALASLPLVLLVFRQFINHATADSFIFSLMGVALVSLISIFGFLNLVFFSIFLTISEMLLGQARIKLLRFLAVFIFGWGMAAFWYHPGFLLSLAKSPQGEMVLSTLSKLIPLSFFIVPVFGAFSFLIFDRKPNLQPLFLSFSLVSFYLIVVSASSFGMALPLPDRFLPEFFLSLSFLGINLVVVFWQIWHHKILGGLQISPRLGLLHSSRGILMVAFFVAFLSWPLFSLGKEPLFSVDINPQVLGTQSSWRIETQNPISTAIGFIISFLTCSATIFLKKKIKA